LEDQNKNVALINEIASKNNNRNINENINIDLAYKLASQNNNKKSVKNESNG